MSHLRMTSGSPLEEDDEGDEVIESNEKSSPPAAGVVASSVVVAVIVDAFTFVLLSDSAEFVVRMAFWIERDTGNPRGDCLSFINADRCFFS